MPARATCSGERPRSDAPASRISPRAGVDEAHDRVQRRRLARAVRADQPDDLAARDLDREAAHGRDAAVARRRGRRSRASPSLIRVVLAHGALAEVGGGDVEVGADLARRALGQRRAAVEHVDAVADVHDQRHVVVDQEHAGAVVVAHGAHDGGELGHLGLGQPGRGLVHQHEARAPSRARGRRRGAARRRARASPRGSVLRAPSRLQQRRAARRRAARASRGAAPTPSAATSTFSRTERSRNDFECWNVRASPARPRRCGLQLVISRSAELDRSRRSGSRTRS